MTYTEQIEAYVGAYPDTATACVPDGAGIKTLPAYPLIEVCAWDDPWCELLSAAGDVLARFRFVG